MLNFTNEKTIIIINLITLTTQWVHLIDTKARQILKVSVEGIRLYVLDSNQTLPIFEKEE